MLTCPAELQPPPSPPPPPPFCALTRNTVSLAAYSHDNCLSARCVQGAKGSEIFQCLSPRCYRPNETQSRLSLAPPPGISSSAPSCCLFSEGFSLTAAGHAEDSVTAPSSSIQQAASVAKPVFQLGRQNTNLHVCQSHFGT